MESHGMQGLFQIFLVIYKNNFNLLVIVINCRTFVAEKHTCINFYGNKAYNDKELYTFIAFIVTE